LNVDYNGWSLRWNKNCKRRQSMVISFVSYESADSTHRSVSWYLLICADNVLEKRA
jgi:hypothetical protein